MPSIPAGTYIASKHSSSSGSDAPSRRGHQKILVVVDRTAHGRPELKPVLKPCPLSNMLKCSLLRPYLQRTIPWLETLVEPRLISLFVRKM